MSSTFPPLLGRLTLQQWQTLRLSLRDSLKQVEAIVPACMHCVHFPDGRRCSKFDAEPPQEFRNTPESCEAWEWDGVPF